MSIRVERVKCHRSPPRIADASDIGCEGCIAVLPRFARPSRRRRIVPRSISLPAAAPGRRSRQPGYLLPWAGGEIHSVTQGEETTLTHNGTAAYAFDFDLDYETVVAARAGKVAYVRDDSNSGGCDADLRRQRQLRRHRPRRWHLGAVPAPCVRLRAREAGRHRRTRGSRSRSPARRGSPAAAAATTTRRGRTCTSRWSARRRTATSRSRCRSPSTTSRSNDGVPVEGKSYVSGNYGRGKPQKIKLTPWRVPREFNPRRQAARPGADRGARTTRRRRRRTRHRPRRRRAMLRNHGRCSGPTPAADEHAAGDAHADRHGACADGDADPFRARDYDATATETATPAPARPTADDGAIADSRRRADDARSGRLRRRNRRAAAGALTPTSPIRAPYLVRAARRLG